MKIVSVVGARPNFVKVAPLIEAIGGYNKKVSSANKRICHTLVHTGQHYDYKMSGIFFKELKIPQPNVFLNVGSGTNAAQTAGIMLRLEKLLMQKRPDIVLVYGDVNSTLAGALAAAKLQIKVAHVEAGLRSFDQRMPEEVNRVLTDHISDFLFTSCRDANTNLRRENLGRRKTYFVGNIMVDTLFKCMRRIKDAALLDTMGLTSGGYALLTLHRPENVDNKETLNTLLDIFRKLEKDIKLVFPVHPRTQETIRRLKLKNKIRHLRNFLFINPMGYLAFLGLMKNARFVLTDSGGIQEETTVLDVPCLTLREGTERPITVRNGSNIIVGQDKQRILSVINDVMSGKRKHASSIELWDGLTAPRIVKALIREI